MHHALPRASAAIDQAAALCADHDLTSYLNYVEGQRAQLMLITGAWDQATAHARSILTQPRLPFVTRLRPLTVLGLIQARRGQDDAEALLDQALGADEPTNMQLLPVRAARAEAAWLAGDESRAREEAQRGLATVTPEITGWTAGALTRWLRRAGGTPESGWPAATPFALELSGRWEAAAAAWEALGCPYDAAVARLDGNAAALRDALATFDALGARTAAARTRRLMQQRGIRPPAHGPRRSTQANPAGLTNREMEVLKLVRDGLTDAEIADQLVISPKTVGHHVGSILAKLGAKSRREAGRMLP